jgi:thiol-disulfide isomerase/thioredoxin
MKKIIGFFFLIIGSIGLSSCDKVSQPLEKVETTVDDFATVPTDTNSSAVDLTQSVRKVLLEDYTGHTCGNCPAAAIVAENLYSQNNGKVIALAVHAGFFSKTKSTHPTTYTTTVGNDWDGSSGFGVSSAGNPNGMVNRKDYGGSGLIQKESKWPTSISLALSDNYVLSLNVTSIYAPSINAIKATVKAKFKNAYGSNTKLSVLLMEDSLVSAQTDYSQNPDYIPNYVFMHVLRGSLNGSWGQTLKNIPIAANDTVTVNTTKYTLNPLLKPKHLYIVAFAYDAVSREVLQVEKVKIM